MNAQANQMIDTVEGTLKSEISQKFDNLQYLISRLTNQQQVQEKGKCPSQTQPNPRKVHEVSSTSEPTPIMDEVKVVITLRSGKEVEQLVLKPAEEVQEAKETEPVEELIKENAVKKSTPPPFP